ncbi:MAG: nucleotidyl transferase AbiEii/AbiGii toxin family protein [Planctomycetes bacterium]|nr:nucleotidyl transferase AbiEii/AbiGii toxin family protein [Planctomycetota bacterium]
MKDEAVALARGVGDPNRRLNLLREYLQAKVLRSLHESEAFLCLSFVGGTALRLLFGLPRFSEDLDFTLGPAQGYRGEEWMEKVKRDLLLAGFDAQVTWNDRKTVHAAGIRIGELLHLVGLTPLPRQKLSIKLEIDTRPPGGAGTERRVVERHGMFVLRHDDLPSLMAGKLHALLARKYPKGRDWYDLIWYRAQRPPIEPNLTLLQHALDQTEGAGKYKGSQWPRQVAKRAAVLDFDKLAEDVLPFLERPGEATLITRENVLSLLRD